MVLNAVSVVSFDHKSIISSNVFVRNHYKPVIKSSANSSQNQIISGGSSSGKRIALQPFRGGESRLQVTD